MGERTTKAIIGGAAAAVGTYALASSLGSARKQIAHHFNTTLRSSVDAYCGTALTDRQWVDLIRTPEWLAFRRALPFSSSLQAIWNSFEPVARFWVGGKLAGISVALLLSAASDEDVRGWPGAVSLGFLFTLGVAGKILFLDPYRQALVLFNGAEPPAESFRMCEKARQIAGEDATASAHHLAANEMLSFGGIISISGKEPGPASMPDEDAASSPVDTPGCLSPPIAPWTGCATMGTASSAVAL